MMSVVSVHPVVQTVSDWLSWHLKREEEEAAGPASLLFTHPHTVITVCV